MRWVRNKSAMRRQLLDDEEERGDVMSRDCIVD